MKPSVLWKARHIFYHLLRRDILVTYKQTVLGVFWTVLKPMLTAAIIVLVFKRIGNFPSYGFPYILISLSALTFWEFFSNSVNRASICLIDDRDLITRVSFPRIVLLINAAFRNSLGLIINLVVTIGFVIYHDLPVLTNLFWFPAIYLCCLLLNLALGLWLGTLNVFYRDVTTLVPFLLRVGLFISPVGFTLNSVPESWRPIYCINPLVGIVESMRYCILGEQFRPDFTCLFIGSISLFLLLISGLYLFGCQERKFADLI